MWIYKDQLIVIYYLMKFRKSILVYIYINYNGILLITFGGFKIVVQNVENFFRIQKRLFLINNKQIRFEKGKKLNNEIQMNILNIYKYNNNIGERKRKEIRFLKIL